MGPQENLENGIKSHQTGNVRRVKSLSAQTMIFSDHIVRMDREAAHTTLTRPTESQPVLTVDPSSLVVRAVPVGQEDPVGQEVQVGQEVHSAYVPSGPEDLEVQEALVVQVDPEVQVV